MARSKFRHPLDGARRHQLMTEALASEIPALYSQENSADPIVYAKYFHPYGPGTWLVTEFDGNETAFGFAEIHRGMGELGFISISELAGLNRRGLPLIERDLHFKPCRLSQARKSERFG